MPVTNKIQIGVEVVNQTAAPLSKIKTDIGNMSKSMQASLGATNTLISQGMIKAASTVSAATKAASVSASGSFQTIQFNAAASAKGMSASFAKEAAKVDAEIKRMSKMTISPKADTSKIFSTVTKDIKSELKDINSEFKRGTVTIEEYSKGVQQVSEVYNLLAIKCGKFNAELEKQIKAAKKLIDEKNKDTDATNKQSNALSQLAKRFLTIAAAIYLARRAYQLLIQSAKDYETAARMGDTGAIAKLTQSFGQIRVEIGSVVETALADLAAYVEANGSQIQEQARQLTQVVIGMVKIGTGIIGVVSNTIYAVMGTLLTGTSAILSAIFNLIDNTLMKIPGIPKAVKEGWADATDAVDQFVATQIEFTKQAGEDILDSFGLVADGFTDLTKATVDSGVKYVSDKTNAAQEKYKSDFAAMLEWLKQLQDKFNASLMDEFTYRQTKINEEYVEAKKKLYEAENKFKIDTTLQSLQLDVWYAAESDKIDQDRFKKKTDIIEAIEQRQKDAYEAAKSAAKSAGIGMGTPMLTPGSRASSLGSQAFTGQQAIADQITEMNKAYEQMVATGMYKDAELAQARIDIETNTTNAIKQLDYDLLQTRMSNAQETMSMYTNAASMITDIANTMTETQLNNLAKETEARYEALDVAFKADTKFTKNKGKLEKQYADEKEKIQKEQEAKEKEFRNKQKGWSIAQASISGAEAIMNAWVQAMKLPSPINMIMGSTLTALITASTAAQIANIESQKFAKGGIVDGPRTGDQVQANVNGGEMILTNQQQAALWGKLSSGSYGSSSNISIGGDTIVVQGNMDKDAADRLIRNRNERMKLLKDDIRELSYRGQLAYA